MSVWNIKPNGLLITFETGKVAPYIYGPQTVLVPYSALMDVIPPESPIADCITHRSRCLSNNLLTGGFIDEASAVHVDFIRWGQPKKESRHSSLVQEKA
ncbi:MAG: DUF3298 domain-containing protein [Gammaproteobacteria bacterium]|nr:DUF3298 domain-containing protein [Gammaproteobacteria bacterium]